jgi:WD repeat-containing protein 26
MNGKLVDSYHLPRLYSHDVAVTPDEQRIIAVATLTESQDGFQPHKARKEKRIVGKSFVTSIVNIIME